MQWAGSLSLEFVSQDFPANGFLRQWEKYLIQKAFEALKFRNIDISLQHK